MLDIVYSPSQLVENHDSSFDERTTVRCGFHAVRATIQQGHPEQTFDVGNRLGHNRRGNSKVTGGLHHAPPSHDLHEDMQVAQFYAAADTVCPRCHVSPVSRTAN